MTIVRVNSADIDRERLRAEIAALPEVSEEEIERHAAEDGDAWTDEDFHRARIVLPRFEPDRIRALRARLGLSQERFARRFGFSPDAIEQYEQGRRVPRGSASNLLRVIEADPDLVARVLAPRARAAREAASAP